MEIIKLQTVQDVKKIVSFLAPLYESTELLSY